jgi:hypothetical protein
LVGAGFGFDVARFASVCFAALHTPYFYFAVGGGEDVGGELAHGGVGALVVVGFALEGVEPAFDDAPGVVGGRDFAGLLGFVAEAPELGVHDGVALALVRLFGGNVGLVLEFAEQLDRAESRLEPLDAGGQFASGFFGVFLAVTIAGFGVFDGPLLVIEGLQGLAGDGVQTLVFEPAIEAFLLAGGGLAFFARVGFATPVGHVADDLGDAALEEAVLLGELGLGFAGDLPGDVDFLVAGGRGGAFAGFADRRRHGEAPERVSETGFEFRVSRFTLEEIRIRID